MNIKMEERSRVLMMGVGRKSMELNHGLRDWVVRVLVLKMGLISLSMIPQLIGMADCITIQARIVMGRRYSQVLNLIRKDYL